MIDGRRIPLIQEPPVDGETSSDAVRRRERNRRARQARDLILYEQCGQCGDARINVIHEQDPATSIEGPDYYADFVDELHEFVPTGEQVR